MIQPSFLDSKSTYVHSGMHMDVGSHVHMHTCVHTHAHIHTQLGLIIKKGTNSVLDVYILWLSSEKSTIISRHLCILESCIFLPTPIFSLPLHPFFSIPSFPFHFGSTLSSLLILFFLISLDYPYQGLCCGSSLHFSMYCMVFIIENNL